MKELEPKIQAKPLNEFQNNFITEDSQLYKIMDQCPCVSWCLNPKCK